MVKNRQEILERVERNEAVVLTIQEVGDLVAAGQSRELENVDVVTTATRAIMSGTYAVLSFPVAESGTFLRAKQVSINGIPSFVGPCPNENLGVLDLVVFGTAHSKDRHNYGGGHLFRDLVERKDCLVEVITDRGKSISVELGLDEMPHARLFGSRHAFMNYSAFVNPGEFPVSTIFHAREFCPNLTEATFSGCGEINPLKNDPMMENIGEGTRGLFNGAIGFVLGIGTRSTPSRPNISGFADMHKMIPEYMGGFNTAAGPECISSWALPVLVTSRKILKEITRPDQNIALPVMDVNTRKAIGQADYGDVWKNVDLDVNFDQDSCQECARCFVAAECPMNAVKHKDGKIQVDKTLCFHCGLCANICPGKAFRCRLGKIEIMDCSGAVRTIPVVLRQSDRLRAIRMADELKRMIQSGSFELC